MKVTIKAVLLLCFFGSLVFAQRPKIAVYVSEHVSGYTRELRAAAFRPLVNSGQFEVVERSSAIGVELQRQASGAIDDDQLTAYGRQYGAQYICVVDLTHLSIYAYQVSTRIVDVETAEIVALGAIETDIRSGSDISQAVTSAAYKMLERTRLTRSGLPRIAVYVRGVVAKNDGGVIVDVREERTNNNAVQVVDTRGRQMNNNSTRVVGTSNARLASPPQPVRYTNNNAEEVRRTSNSGEELRRRNNNAERALYTYTLAALFRISLSNDDFRVVERSEAFTSQIDREQIRQRSGYIDDSQIARLGVQYGIRDILIVDIARPVDTYDISARLVNVETASIVNASNVYHESLNFNTLESSAGRMVEDIIRWHKTSAEREADFREAAEGAKRVAEQKAEQEKAHKNAVAWTVLQVIGAAAILIAVIVLNKSSSGTE